MALETLKGVTEIGGFKVTRGKPDDMSWDDYDKTRIDYPIHICDKINSISFTLQKGPVKENGINGCQIDTMIEAAIMMLLKLNDQVSCGENAHAIVNLKAALTWLDKRRTDRLLRGVEGTSQT